MLDADIGALDMLVNGAMLAARTPADNRPYAAAPSFGGRELFTALRSAVGRADNGASLFATRSAG